MNLSRREGVVWRHKQRIGDGGYDIETGALIVRQREDQI